MDNEVRHDKIGRRPRSAELRDREQESPELIVPAVKGLLGGRMKYLHEVVQPKLRVLEYPSKEVVRRDHQRHAGDYRGTRPSSRFEIRGHFVDKAAGPNIEESRPKLMPRRASPLTPRRSVTMMPSA